MTGIVRALCIALAANGLVAGRALAHEGWGIVRDSHGRIYVTDIPANTIWRIDRDGRTVPVLRDIHSHALVAGEGGAVYGSHVHLTQPIRSLWRLDQSGRVATIIPPTHGLPVDLQPFLLGSDGALYSVSLHEAALSPERRRLFLLRRSGNGAIDTLAGGLKGFADGQRLDARFTNIMGMSWLPDSSLLFVDGTRLRRLTRDGVVTTLHGQLTEPAWDGALMGLSTLPDGSAVVADFAGRRVLRVDSSGVREVTKSGSYWSPTGVLGTAAGVYTLEHPRAPLGMLGDLGLGPYLRVRLVRPDGSIETLATVWGRRTKPVAWLLGGITMLLVAWRRT